MKECAMMLPILTGKRQEIVEFANALAGPRNAEYVASQQTVTRESWFIQPTPMGDFLIVHFEAADPMAVFAGLADSKEPFDVWFREIAQSTTGIDLTQLPAGLPSQIFEWKRF